MSWASRRRTSYTLGVVIFFAVVIGGALAYWYFCISPTRSDGIRKQGATTPVIEARINAGNRIVAHTYFEFTAPFTWERMKNNATTISVNNKNISNIAEAPRLSALAQNNSVVAQTDISFVAVIGDPGGNACTASATSLERLNTGESSDIVFTCPDPFTIQPSRLKVIPIVT